MSAITPLVYQLGIGGIGGFIAGYAFKKFLKIVAVVIGLFIAALVYLGYKGIITINFGELENAASGLTGQATGVVNTIIALVPSLGAFGLAFLLGFKIG